MGAAVSDEVKKKRGIQAEMLVGISAVFIGLCALFVSLYEAKLMREEQRSSVLPILELARSYYARSGDDADGRWRLTFHAENVGIGPARVLDFKVTVDGVAYSTWSDALEALVDEDVEIAGGQSTINGRTIPAERMITMFDLDTAGVAREIVEGMNSGRLNFEACYCSVFDECWKTDYQADLNSARPVQQCLRDKDSFTQ